MLRLNKVLLGLAGFALCLSGCATVNGPEDLGELQYTGFNEKSDGTAYQSVMGLTCPEEIDGMRRGSTASYNDQGTDIGCNYVDEDRVFTIYLSRFPNDTVINNFRSSQYHLENRLTPEGYVYNEELSDSCSSESLDLTAMMSGLSGILTGENTKNEITLSPSPSAVYITDSSMSIIVVEEMLEKEFFKVRYTGPYTGESSVEASCKLARDTYLSMKQGVEKDRGIEVSKEDMLRALINSTDDS